jgi:hypothetical protein
MASAAKKVRLSDDITALPPPKQLRTMTFGYHTAAADVLWATLMVEYGIHSEEHRVFHGVSRYLDGILELEPTHSMVYRFVDTLLVYRPGGEIATEKEVHESRAYLERGTRERPYDPDVWLHYGQFIAFLAPTFLKDEEEIQRWRKEGALAMARAIELGSNPDRTLTVASLLGRAGERKAAIQQLQRAFALTENPDTRQQIVLQLARLKGNGDVENRVGTFERQWRTHYPFLTREGALLLGPERPTAKCAGPTSGTKDCPPDWSAATSDDR